MKRLSQIQKYLHRLPISRGRAILFGSVARGDFIAESDTDLLIVSPDFPADVQKRMSFLFTVRGVDWQIEPIGWTEKEYQRRIYIGDPFFALLEKEGLPIPWEKSSPRE